MKRPPDLTPRLLTSYAINGQMECWPDGMHVQESQSCDDDTHSPSQEWGGAIGVAEDQQPPPPPTINQPAHRAARL